MSGMSDREPNIFATPVNRLLSVGPKWSEALERLGLRTARDCLFYFPRDYQDLTDLDSIEDLEDGALVRLRARVLDIENRMSGQGRSISGVLVRVGPGNVRALWFNQPYMRDKFKPGDTALLEG